jgi:hypothetical protein
MSLKMLCWRVTCQWKCYINMSLKRLPWHVTAKDTLMSDMSLKMLPRYVTVKATLMWHMFLLSYGWGNYSLLEPIKARHEGRSIHTPKSEIMGSKEPEPWSPRWVRVQLRGRNNSLPPNDPYHDEKPLTRAERPLHKCDLDCQSHMSIDYDTYNRRYWSYPLPTSPFNWGWDEKQPRKVV